MQVRQLGSLCAGINRHDDLRIETKFATGGFQRNGRSARCVTASADSPNATVPPKSLTPRDREAIASLLDDRYSPAKWPGPALLLGALSGLQLESNTKAPGPALLLGALSGLQLESNTKAFNCLGLTLAHLGTKSSSDSCMRHPIR